MCGIPLLCLQKGQFSLKALLRQPFRRGGAGDFSMLWTFQHLEGFQHLESRFFGGTLMASVQERMNDLPSNSCFPTCDLGILDQ